MSKQNRELLFSEGRVWNCISTRPPFTIEEIASLPCPHVSVGDVENLIEPAWAVHEAGQINVLFERRELSRNTEQFEDYAKRIAGILGASLLGDL